MVTIGQKVKAKTTRTEYKIVQVRKDAKKTIYLAEESTYGMGEKELIHIDADSLEQHYYVELRPHRNEALKHHRESANLRTKYNRKKPATYSAAGGA